MSAAKPNVLRRVAEHELEQTFCDLTAAKKAEFATSLVRQWATNAGEAVILTLEREFWFHLSRLDGGGTQVVRDVQPGTLAGHLRRSRVIEEEIPALLDALSVRQSVQCYNDDGELLQLRVSPAEKKYYIELVPDSER
jgi:hypothetical protein